MLLQSILVTALAATANCFHHLPACRAADPSHEHREASRLMAIEEKANIFHRSAEDPPVEVDLVFHIIRKDETRDGGNIADSDLALELKYINNNYKPFGFHFNLKNTTRTLNTTWAKSKDEYGMKKALRQGSYKTLNLYYLPKFDAAGDCYLPTKNAKPDSKSFILDGCRLVTESCFEDGQNRDDGKTATHEIGHWLGLYHTFEGGCEGDGDYVDDTPATTGDDYSCKDTTDTCPKQRGVDPIYNYMTYTFCSHFEFTKGQGIRMHNQWTTYRANAK